MSTAKPTVMLAVQPLYVARQEAAAMLSISEATLESLVAKREAPAPTAPWRDQLAAFPVACYIAPASAKNRGTGLASRSKGAASRAHHWSAAFLFLHAARMAPFWRAVWGRGQPLAGSFCRYANLARSATPDWRWG